MAKKPAKTPEPAPKVRRFKGVKETAPATVNPQTPGVLIEGTPENIEKATAHLRSQLVQGKPPNAATTLPASEWIGTFPKPGDVYEPAVAEGDVHAGDPVIAGRKTGHVKAFHPLKKRLPKGTEIRLVMGDGRWVGWLQSPLVWMGGNGTAGARIEASNPSLARTVKALLDAYNRMNGTAVADEDKL